MKVPRSQKQQAVMNIARAKKAEMIVQKISVVALEFSFA